MVDQLELLERVVHVLESLQIAHMVVGSYASGAWGEPRFTQDIDMVVDLAMSEVDRLVDAFPLPDYYVSREAAMEAVRDGGQFNIIHPTSGNKVDFMLAGRDAWRRNQLARRRQVEIQPGLTTYVAAPEDVIIGKMLYYREGGSEKHLRDITGILMVSGDEVDRAYVRNWAEELGLTVLWRRILQRLNLNVE